MSFDLQGRTEVPANKAGGWRAGLWRLLPWLLAAACVALAIGELRTSWLQSQVFAGAARLVSWRVESGPAPEFRHPHSGPYDARLGHSRLGEVFDRLEESGWRISAQSRGSTWFVRMMDWGLFPAYREKTQAGLQVMDQSGRHLFSSRWPERIYSDFEAVPEIVTGSLLFIENREVLGSGESRRNPAVEWDRLATAAVGLGLNKLGASGNRSGGSTLATQLEKLRHSPDGITPSVGEKFRQMLSASLRAYQDGPETQAARRRIVCDYLNSVPLAAARGYGEVQGLGDGLAVWFGEDFDETNRLLAGLADPSKPVSPRAARAFREVLTLLLAIRRPTSYLGEDREALRQRVDGYLTLMADAGVISRGLRDRARAQRVAFRDEYRPEPVGPFSARKGVYAIRTGLMQTLGFDSLYELDRMDLTARTTLDAAAQWAVTDALLRLREPEEAAAAGLIQDKLLAQGDPGSVIYSLTLYERAGGANILRIQADNYDQPLSINEGTKLELGSTAKLRTLISYLEVVAELREELGALTWDELNAFQPAPDDHLSHWARDYLLHSDPALDRMLDASLDRRYSASPDESFFTGGGLHKFANFDRADNTRMVTVRDAFHRSVNLAFIRLMRDLVHYRMYRMPGVVPALLADVHHPGRREYLDRFSEYEGRQFLREFYAKYDGLKLDMALREMAGGIRMTPRNLAVIYRSVRPDDGLNGFAAFLIGNLLNPYISDELLENLYREYAGDKFSLADRAYLADVHPLELWLLEYRARHPEADLAEIMAASEDAREESYKWLYLPSKKEAQDRAIRVMTERDAFRVIHESWRRQGYPFGWLVPSYATAIGSSGDTPAALAELAGIILNDGVRRPSLRVDRLLFADDTPFETEWEPKPEPGERVMFPEVAALVRKELVAVVEGGSAVRANRSMVLGDGQIVTVGGKTGTGDNRHETYGPGGKVIESRVINRTAAFVFFFGDRFFGAITAYVPGEQAADYGFTSSLPVQLFRNLAPTLASLIEKRYEPTGSPLLVADTVQPASDVPARP